MSRKIKIAIIGVGNCASALIQGISYYKKLKPNNTTNVGLMNLYLGGYHPSDIEVVSAFDIDKRKVNHSLEHAIFSKPNCTPIFSQVEKLNVVVKMGKILDGTSKHMDSYPEDDRFLVADDIQEANKDAIVNELINSGAEIVMNYLPVGSEQASRFYAECALEAGVAFINNMPTFIASSSEWANRFKEKNIPIIGDDIKSQLGATIVHRALSNIFSKRGVQLKKTYQLNTGGNTDFLNMKNIDRLESKRVSKTQAVQSSLSNPLPPNDIHVGPSDYIPWQNDNKICFIRMEGQIFGGAPIELDLKLSVIDSPNSAGIGIDAIRCAKIALDSKIGGILEAPSAYFCKHPPKQVEDEKAFSLLQEFILNHTTNINSDSLCNV